MATTVLALSGDSVPWWPQRYRRSCDLDGVTTAGGGFAPGASTAQPETHDHHRARGFAGVELRDHRRPLDRDTTATPDLPSGLLELFPPRGQLVRPQDQIGAQLAKGWTGELTLDSTPLPDDQYDPIEKANNAIIWRPGPGKVFTQTEPGPHTLTLHFWPIQEGPSGTDARTFSWTFKVG